MSLLPQPWYIYIAYYVYSMNNNRHQISCGMSAFTLDLSGIMTGLKDDPYVRQREEPNSRWHINRVNWRALCFEEMSRKHLVLLYTLLVSPYMLGSDNMTPASVQLPTIKDASYRLVVFKCSLELAQCHVGGGTAVISLNVIFVYLQGLRSVSQGIAIALCA